MGRLRLQPDLDGVGSDWNTVADVRHGDVEL
jgi:hypothetical protein